jgi:two-component system, OmpR family, sensor histidine kinase MprB
MRLRARLTIGTGILIAVAVAGGFVVAYVLVREQLTAQLDRALRDRVAPLATRLEAPQRTPRLQTKLPRPPFGEAAGYLQFVQANGHVVLVPGEHVKLPTTGARAVATGQRKSFFRDARVAGTRVRIYTTRAAAGTAVQIARPLTEVDHALAQIKLLFAIISLVVVAAAAALGRLVARTTLRPIRRLTEHAEQIAATRDLRSRAAENGRDELGRLAIAFNTMLDALAESVRSQRQLVADASHELRTPLATARTNLEVMEIHDEMPRAQRKRILADAIVELREMTYLIEELMQLASGDVQPPQAMQPTRLDLLTEEAVEVAKRRSGRAFRTELETTLVQGSPDALARAIANLLDNAVKWSPADQPIDVTVRAGRISVRDRGPGIDPADLPHIFDRFYRAASARTMPGSGLGLAIVRQTADAHSGTVTAAPAHAGGTILTLQLPVLQQPAETVAGQQ